MKEANKTKEQLLSKVLENADFGLMLTTEQGEILYENEKFYDSLGIDAETFVKRYSPSEVECPFVLNNRIVTKFMLFYEATPCICFFAMKDPDKQKLIWDNIQYRDILERIDNGVVLTDPNGMITFYNQSHAVIDGFRKEEVLGKHLSQVYRIENHTNVLNSKKAIEMRFHYYATVQRDHIPLVTGTYPVLDPESGNVLGVYSMERDITQIHELQQKVARLEKEVTKERWGNHTSFTFDNIIGKSLALENAIQSAEQFAAAQSPVLIYGETGTGKELFAQSIHNSSPNCYEPFVAVNCGAIPENLIESTLFGAVKGAYTGAENSEGLFLTAKKGTLFLDEVNSMPMQMQTKLLRVLQEKMVRPVGSQKEYPIECRILSSCNADPEEALKEKVFRNDLYYRLAIMRVNIPPLREREGDALLLAYHFAEKYAVTYRKEFLGFDEHFIEFLNNYSWPGNVRELEFTIEGCIAMLNDREKRIMIKHLPANLQRKITRRSSFESSLDTAGLPDILAEYEKNLILHALEKNSWNVSKAAEHLNIQRQNLQQRMKKLHIQRPEK